MSTVLAPVRVSARLPHPPERVWDVVADSRRDPEWCPLVPSVMQTVGDGPGPDARYAFQQTLPNGRVVEGTIQVLDYVRPAHIAWDVEDAVRRYRIELVLARDGVGTRVQQVSHPTFKRRLGWRRLLVPAMTRRMLRRQFRALGRLLAEERQ